MTREKAEYIGNNEEARKYFEHVEVTRSPVTSLKTPPFTQSFAEVLTKIFASHGIQVKIEIGCYIVTFPEGTYKTEMLPRTHDEKYKIVLPDKFELLEIRRLFAEYSYLQIDTDQLSPEQQSALKIRNVREKKIE
jgi:hypothetical protein